MATFAKDTTTTLVPGLRYRDAPAAIDWLCSAFGFERHLVVTGEDEGIIVHAQLTFGNGMIMLGSVMDNEFGRHIKQPDEIGRCGNPERLHYCGRCRRCVQAGQGGRC